MRLGEALRLRDGDVVAFVGGGGKTTAMYRLAREAAEDGGRAVATGTTLFTPPPVGGAPIVLADPGTVVEAVARTLAREPWLIAATGRADKGRLEPVPPDIPAAFARLHGVTRVAVEADGSRMRPLKAPADHEPALPEGVTLVVACAGIDVLGKSLTEANAHRPERIGAITTTALGEPITEETIATALAHHRGGRKGVAAGTRFAVMLNKVDGESIDAARRIARLLRVAGVDLVVLASVRDADPVLEVVGARA